MEQDVIVVGGGSVGLMTGLLLARAGVQVTIIEAEPDIVPSARAAGYPWPMLEALEYHGLLDDMLTAGFLNDYLAFRVFKTGEVIDLDLTVLHGLVHHPYSLILGQDKFAEILVQHLANEKNARILWNTRFISLVQDDQGVSVHLEGEGPAELRAAWVIGADGGRSKVRKAVNVEFHGVTWPRRFVATNVYYPFDKYNYPGGYLVDPKYGAVIGPVQADGLWRVTFSEMEDLPLEGMEQRIDAFLRHVLPGGHPYDLRMFSPYKMHQRSAGTYRVGRVLLCGDSAHVTNPTSGYGLVSGLYDSFSLTEALAAHIQGKVSDEILDRYSHERRTVFLTVTSPISSESMRMVFYNDDPNRLENDLITLRARRDDKGAMRRAVMAPTALETPSLIDGRTFAQKLVERGRLPGPISPEYAVKFMRPNGPIKVGRGSEPL